MRFNTSLLAQLAFATTAFASGVVIPIGSANGIYLHQVDADGTVRTEYLGAGPVTLPSAPSTRAYSPVYARAGYSLQCQNIGVNQGDKENAEKQLASAFAGGSFFRGTISSVSGSAVAYGCDYGNGQTMSSEQFQEFMSALDGQCGAATAGWYSIPDWAASYGRTNAGVSFC